MDCKTNPSESWDHRPKRVTVLHWESSNVARTMTASGPDLAGPNSAGERNDPAAESEGKAKKRRIQQAWFQEENCAS